MTYRIGPWIALLIFTGSLVCGAEEKAQPAVLLTTSLDTEVIETKRKDYPRVIGDLEAQRQALASEWSKASAGERRKILSDARKTVLTKLLGHMFPAWYGTGWDFNGVTQQPGEGKIACGYFVTTCLRDAGFDLPRIRLAQQPSQTIIKTLADKGDISLLYDKPMAEIERHLQDSGPGLYIVGLDQHTGFVVNDGRSLAFVHSSYYDPPFSVIAEPIDGWNPLAKSRYRLFGKILGDEMIQKWILAESFSMRL